MTDHPVGQVRRTLGARNSNEQGTVDRYIRLFGCSVFVILIAAYATGEEFVHTHEMIGYAIAVLVISALIWEIITRRAARVPRDPAQHDGMQSAAIGLLIILPIASVLASTALLLMVVTHNYWGATLVDEMHEVVAYFGVGLLVFYVASVLVTSIASMRAWD